MAATFPLREALNATISSGRLEDTKVILYSRRDPFGTICQPRALYASSHVLRTVPYFNDLLFGTFAEAESKDFSEPLDDNECAEGYGYHPDSDLEEEDDAVNPKETLNRTIPHTFDPFRSPLSDNKPTLTDGERGKWVEKGKVIKIHDVAFITFQAFLLYLYTGHIEFAPHGSEENRKLRSTEIVSTLEDSIPRPSPKSIYRLADKYDVPTLKGIALDSIRDDLKRCDIVEEIFSGFTSKYEEIRAVQIDHLLYVRFCGDKESTDELYKKIDDKVESYANGDLDHAAEVMSLLWKLSRSGGSLPPPTPSTRSFVPQVPGPANWKPLKTALIKSIRDGAFFDRKYLTRNSNTAKILQPIYFSSVVAREKVSHINGLAEHWGEKAGYFDKGVEPDDSDCESDSGQVGSSAPRERVNCKKESEQELLPVLTIGSFAAWRSLFFYLCTDVIQFAPLKSQGADARAQYIQEQTTSDKPPPCSPKVIYSLAAALNIEPLRRLAMSDIRSKITSANVVNELFSGFTSRQGDVMKMQWELLNDNYDNDNTSASAVDIIKRMTNGNTAYRAGALKLGLRNGFSMAGVLLRCPRNDCELHYNPVSYRSMGAGVKCKQTHRHSLTPYLECTNCGFPRTESKYTSCQNCLRRFR